MIFVLPAEAGTGIPALLQKWPGLEERKPLISIPYASTPPTIDGKLETGEWDMAAKITNFIDFKKERKAVVPTFFYLTYDKSYLYVGFHCTLLGKPLADVTKPDGPVWLDNAVELFLAPPL